MWSCLTSRPLEASDAGFLDDLLFLFGNPIGSGQSLVDGSLRMRYCSANFSCKKPTWRLPQSGGVAALVAVTSVRMAVDGSLGSGDVPSVRDFRNDKRMRIRLTKKTNVRKRFGVNLGEQPIPKRWKFDILKDVRIPGGEGGMFCSGDGLFHVDEPKGIG